MTVSSIAANRVWNTAFNAGMIMGAGQNMKNLGIVMPAPFIPNANMHIRAAGFHMLNAMRGFGMGNFGFGMRGESSNPNVADISINRSQLRSNQLPPDMNVNVQQTALAQQNAGTAMLADVNTIGVGTFEFTIETGGQTHKFGLVLAVDDKNATTQQRMADAINQRNIGINATVTTGTNAQGDATSTLNLAARNTGTNNVFTVADVHPQGLASVTGVNSVNQNARNAQFVINNGAAQTSQTNQINIRDGITLNLLNKGSANITFRRGFNNFNIGSANTPTNHSAFMANNIVDSLNFALSLGNNAGNGNGIRGSDRFLADVRGALNTFSSQLANVGISVHRNRISVNQNTLRAAAEDGRLEQLLNKNSPFMTRMERIAKNAFSSSRYMTGAAPINFMPSQNPFSLDASSVWSFMNVLG